MPITTIRIIQYLILLQGRVASRVLSSAKAARTFPVIAPISPKISPRQVQPWVQTNGGDYASRIVGVVDVIAWYCVARPTTGLFTRRVIVYSLGAVYEDRGVRHTSQAAACECPRREEQRYLFITSAWLDSLLAQGEVSTYRRVLSGSCAPSSFAWAAQNSGHKPRPRFCRSCW